MPRELERSAYPWDASEMLWSLVATVVPEADLFDGLDVAAWDAASPASVVPLQTASRPLLP